MNQKARLKERQEILRRRHDAERDAEGKSQEMEDDVEHDDISGFDTVMKVLIQSDSPSVLSPQKSKSGKAEKSAKKSSGDDILSKLQAKQLLEDNEKKEKQLIEEMDVICKNRKKALQERLQKRKAIKDAKADQEKSTVDDEDSSSGAYDAQRIAAIDAAYEKMKELIREEKTRSDIGQVSKNELMTVMDKLMSGEDISSFPSTMNIVADVHAQKKNSEEIERQLKEAEIKKKRDEENRLATMKEEVKSKTAIYSESKQKLELSNKLQQARQRQNLQRRIFERKQAQKKKTGQ